MSAQVYSAPGQTEGRRKTFLEWKSRDFSYWLSLTCWGNVNYNKSVHHPIPTRENRKKSRNLFISKLKSSFHTASGWSGCFKFLLWFNSAFLLSKMKSLFFSLWTKICQILHVILKSASQFSFTFCINLHCHQK